MSIEIIWFLLLCLGILIAELVTGRPNGPLSSLSAYPNQKMSSMFIGFGVSKMERAYHIHHWVWAAIISIALITLGYWVWAAFFCGITLQGLAYGDRFKFKVDAQEEEE